MAGLADAIATALHDVIDPELGENVVDMGLIYDIAVSADGDVAIVMTTTTQGCPASAFLKDGVRACASAVPGVRRVEVVLTYQPAWSPERMSAPARERLGLA
jgi:metal-sulfur cluster biosynthetic enzyme